MTAPIGSRRRAPRTVLLPGLGTACALLAVAALWAAIGAGLLGDVAGLVGGAR